MKESNNRSSLIEVSWEAYAGILHLFRGQIHTQSAVFKLFQTEFAINLKQFQALYPKSKHFSKKKNLKATL